MPSYDELDNEVWWVREYEPAPLSRFNSKLRARYNLTRSQCGSKGDNVHLRGRHRSRNWCLNSQHCTNRSYATTDARDKRGPGDALRATDLGLQGPELWAVCRRVDAAVRAGKLPQMAEWFGTFDGKTVVGWSNGRPATSDGSHLYHGHFGYWTESVEDAAFFDLLFSTITGGPFMALTDQQQEDLYRRVCNLDAWMHQGLSSGLPDVSGLHYGFGKGSEQPSVPFALNATLAKLSTAGVDPAALAAALAPYLPKPPTAAEIAKAVLAEQVRELTD